MEKIKNYIINLAKMVNEKYGNIITEEMINQAIDRYCKSNEDEEKVISDINGAVKKVINDKLQENGYKDNITYSRATAALDKVLRMLGKDSFRIFIAGGLVSYLLLNEDSNRLHSDIDTICWAEDMDKLRNIFKAYGLYKDEWDSINYVTNGNDYGFEIVVDGVPLGIYPFTYENGVLIQFSYDPNSKKGKIKEIQLEKISDYIMSYKAVNGQVYNTMSLEYIKMTKDKAHREKDVQDLAKISKTGLLRDDVLNRIQMYKEIKNENLSKTK